MGGQPILVITIVLLVIIIIITLLLLLLMLLMLLFFLLLLLLLVSLHLLLNGNITTIGRIKRKLEVRRSSRSNRAGQEAVVKEMLSIITQATFLHKDEIIFIEVAKRGVDVCSEVIVVVVGRGGHGLN